MKANKIVSETDFEKESNESWQRIKEDLPGYLDLMGARGSFLMVMYRTSKTGEEIGQTLMHGDILKIGDSLLAACRQYSELAIIVKAVAKKV